MKSIIDKHEKIAFMFSGGKDSLACLFFLRPFLNKINVIWVNTGDIFPENEKIVRDCAEWIPHFIEVKTDVKTFKNVYGIPTDVVPISNSGVGLTATGSKETKLISGYDCCMYNLWIPAMNAIRELGSTLIIRGQRKEESSKAPINNGHVENGVEYLFPIEDWTKQEVLNYLEENGVYAPEFFNFNESSLDCMGCTAFLSGIYDRRAYMKKNHPEQHNKNIININKIIEYTEKELSTVKGYVENE